MLSRPFKATRVSSTTYRDSESLLQDFQTLLTHPSPLGPIIQVAEEKFFISPQILRVRSPYFAALLSPRWLHSRFQKPNTTPQAFQDALEYLTTGTVALSTTESALPHNIRLSALAHELLLDELETVVISHIFTHLKPHVFGRALFPPVTPPPSFQDAMAVYLAENLSLCETLPATMAHVTIIWRLLAHLHITTRLPSDIMIASLYIARHATSDPVNLKTILESEPTCNRLYMKTVLLNLPPVVFACHFENNCIFSLTDLREKYRNDAALAPTLSQQPLTVRLVCESSHPHALAARLEDTIHHVNIPDEDAPFARARLVFDERCALGVGAELLFFLTNPVNGAQAHSFLVGRRLPTELILPSVEFWYAFASQEEFVQDSDLQAAEWGWRFFVEALPPEIDLD